MSPTSYLTAPPRCAKRNSIPPARDLRVRQGDEVEGLRSAPYFETVGWGEELDFYRKQTWGTGPVSALKEIADLARSGTSRTGRLSAPPPEGA